MAKISVLIPTYKRPHLLRQALVSCVQQTRHPDEVLVGDNNPESDENRKVVEEFQEKYDFIRYVKNPRNLGALENHKKLFNLAEGQYIIYLADDDFLLPYALEELERAFDTNPDVKIGATRTLFTDMKLNPIINYTYWSGFYKVYNELPEIIDGKEFIRKSLLFPANLCGGWYMFRKKDIDFPLFRFRDYEFQPNSDWFMWMMILRKGGKVFFPKRPLYCMRMGENEQIKPQTAIIGIKERLLFLSDDFLDELGVRLTKREKSEAYERVVISIKLLEDSVRKSQMKDQEREKYLVELYSLLKQFSEEIKRQSSYLVYMSTKKEREAFSIIIVTYNNEDTIESCVGSILKTLREGDEIIVVDNNSTDRTPDVLKRIADKNRFVKLIFNSQNMGYSRAVNRAVKLSKNNFLVFLNPDTVVLTPDWLNLFYEELKKEDVGAVGPVSDAAMWKNSMKRYVGYHWELTPIWLRYFFDECNEETKLLSGFCLSTKKEVFESVGCFDEELILGMDDFDFCMKVRERGLNLKVIPSVFVKHLWGVSFKRSRNADYMNEISVLNFAKKLSRKFGYGNVPLPEKLFSDAEFHFEPYRFMKLRRYRFLFNFSGTEKGKEFFIERGKEIRQRPHISVVVVNHRSSDDLRELLESLLRSGYENMSFVVVDNSEDEEEFERLSGLRKFFGRNFFVIRSLNRGFAAGCNLGIKFSKEEIGAKYIWLLNPDTVVVEGAPLELLKTMLYTDVPVVTCKIKIYGTDHVQYNGVAASEVPMEDKDDYGIFRVNFLSGANIFMRSEVIDKVGYLREDYFLYFEDSEFFQRLKSAGIYPVYTPYTFIYHKVRGNYGIIEKPVNLYYFVRNSLWFFSEFTEKGIYKKEIFFQVLKQIEGIYFTALRLGLEKSVRAVILGIYGFIEGERGKSETLYENLERKKGEFLAEMGEIDRIGDKMPIREYMNLLKLHLLVNPDFFTFSRYMQGLYSFIFSEVLEGREYLFL